MSYRGFIPLLSELGANSVAQRRASGEKEPYLRVLEVGIMDGLSTIPYAVNLQLLGVPYVYEAIDIKIREGVRELHNSILGLENLRLIEANSLSYLEHRAQNLEATQQSHLGLLDIIMIDGDHNYETVKTECELLKSTIHEETIILFDDYNNRHAMTDTYYADLEGYENNTLATPRTEREGPTGVRAAVDEFLAEMGYVGVTVPGASPLLTSSSSFHLETLRRFLGDLDMVEVK
mgnify:CR=1 FL=1|tara:strand:- start:6796 stop:7497 length:702 start_codon:yes stop_codon:yes gene_type:complete